MISCNVNKKNYPCQSISSVLGLNLQQKTIKSFFDNKNVTIKRGQTQKIQKPKIYQSVPLINDENCSFNANTIQVENTNNKQCIKQQNSIFLKSQNKRIESISQDESKKLVQANRVIDLKKKIKKCSGHQMRKSQCYFRENVCFIRKTYHLKNLQEDQSNQQEKLVENNIIQTESTQKKIQTYPVYRDSEVFPGYRSEQFRNRIVPQRMDNDIETDDEQIEKFIHRIKTDFMTHFQKVMKQKENKNKDKLIQKMDESIMQSNEK